MDKEDGVVNGARAVAPANRRSISGKGQETLFFFFKTSSHPLVRTQLHVRRVSWAPLQGREKQHWFRGFTPLYSAEGNNTCMCSLPKFSHMHSLRVEGQIVPH